MRVRNEMVEVEPEFVRATGRCTAPALSAQKFAFLGFGGVSVARVEADVLVLDRWDDVFQGFQIVGSGPRGGAFRLQRFAGFLENVSLYSENGRA